MKKLFFFFYLILFSTITFSNPKIIIINETDKVLRIIRSFQFYQKIGLPNPFIQPNQTVEINLDKMFPKTTYSIKIETSYYDKPNSYFIIKLEPIDTAPIEISHINFIAIPQHEEQYALYIDSREGELYPSVSTTDKKTFKIIVDNNSTLPKQTVK